MYLFSVVFSHQRRRLARRSRRSGNTENGLRGSFVGENRHGSGSSITKKSSVTSVSSARASPVGARETVKRLLSPALTTYPIPIGSSLRFSRIDSHDFLGGPALATICE